MINDSQTYVYGCTGMCKWPGLDTVSALVTISYYYILMKKRTHTLSAAMLYVACACTEEIPSLEHSQQLQTKSQSIT